ncbi:uncharacterized protein LMH87_009007 [Akanthomyces muscarius]|uniref:Uncharacterized protein n=1 Tax=Akanthomyces muscarius TaxID=2231603 RepID=A0A9W8UNZ0_AKAMU|nr:uncharacterized protein LMH87_009007 [Akanthomyces muscarius]KAJ4158484.1 hypothetical protein LMH87_009007 [Akanthomyces muscarius]
MVMNTHTRQCKYTAALGLGPYGAVTAGCSPFFFSRLLDSFQDASDALPGPLAGKMGLVISNTYFFISPAGRNLQALSVMPSPLRCSVGDLICQRAVRLMLATPTAVTSCDAITIANGTVAAVRTSLSRPWPPS